MAIADENGNVLVNYTYDPWGKVISITDKDGNKLSQEPTVDETATIVANEPITKPATVDETTKDVGTATKIAFLNPIRYRSYYYDSETEWYYLKTRYYSPDMCRFINADGYVQTGQGMLDKNMFAYCGNNAINSIDPNGTFHFVFNSKKSVATTSKQLFNNNKYAQIIIPLISPPTIDITEKLNNEMKTNSNTLKKYEHENGYIKSVYYFINKVKPNGDWDFKVQPDWNLNPNATYRYGNHVLRFDDIGNIHYGYVGRVLFSTKVLLGAGGMVQIYTGTSDLSYLDSNFDDPRDQWAIQLGCDIWDMEEIA